MRLRVQFLALLSGLKIRRCSELWCRSQTWLGSQVAVAVAPIRPLAWEPPYVAGVAQEMVKKKKRMEAEVPTSGPVFSALAHTEP